MSESTLIHWIELLAAGLVALATAAAAWIRHLQNAHLDDLREQLRREQEDLEGLREQLRREQEDEPPKSRGPKSARLQPKEK